MQAELLQEEKMILGIVFILSGILASLFSYPLAKGYISYQNQAFGFKFGKKEIAIGRILNVVVGIVFIIFGLLNMLEIFKES